jgi:hypothetical protein
MIGKTISHYRILSQLGGGGPQPGLTIFCVSTPGTAGTRSPLFFSGLKFLMSDPYSVPDCRNYGVFPNNSTDENGTETFVVPAHPSVVAPADSRVNVLTDSRVSAAQNCRTSGVFGPNEP